jgi:enoyl-CoA hydratase/carnithine racemase
MTTYRDWIVTEEQHIAHLILNRPGSRNNLRLETLNELQEICADLQGRKHIWAVILEGRGRHFSSGLEPELIRSIHEQPEKSVVDALRKQQQVLDEFEALEKPTIAKIQGFCIGGGMLLALCCDFRLAGKRSFFCLPEVKMGLPILWGTHRIVRHAGPALAKKLILLGDRFKAAEALDWGLVHKVVPNDQLDIEVEKLAAQLTALPPRTIGMAKRLINAVNDRPAGELLAMEREAILEICASPDAEEAVASFLEKRAPVFVGE